MFSKLVLLSVEMLSKGKTRFEADQRAIPTSCYTYYVPDVVFLSRPELVVCVRNITAANVCFHQTFRDWINFVYLYM